MSKNSKVRRAARKKLTSRSRRVIAPKPPVGPVEAHAELRDADGSLLGGIARRDGEWVLGLDGQIAGGSASAATVLALLQRAASSRQRAGQAIRIKFSDALRDEAQREAGEQGLSLEEFQQRLERELDGRADALGAPVTQH
ncbi:hypothetical protein [Montanilutibacter psychrotolerans]|uniref:Uncharacterized protein n=1 Tax=Montanilutibacter psychrotolerans TaxID=1327343 RepID=A0A3M8SMJ7_9GAMM|nr:hypothetical protein [Lysobacter psychrotolerans]RNF82541.1 hypothetical protein EER27_13605 [Lysobacter psychrotolerans]